MAADSHLASIVTTFLSHGTTSAERKGGKAKKIQHPNLFHTTVIQAKQEKPTFKTKNNKNAKLQARMC